MSQPRGKRCPRCGYVNPPDALYCQNCGARLPDETVVMGAPFTPSQPAAPVQPAAPQPASGDETIVAGVSQQPVRPGGGVAAAPPVTPELPVPYRLVFPDGRYIEVYEKSRVFGREDFEGLIPEPYIRYITRREKGGQFRIWCEVHDINTIVCYIRDDYSTNPTFVNNEPIRGKGWVRLNDGDIISPAGVVNIVFRFAAPVSPPPPPGQQGG